MISITQRMSTILFQTYLEYHYLWNATDKKKTNVKQLQFKNSIFYKVIQDSRNLISFNFIFNILQVVTFTCEHNGSCNMRSSLLFYSFFFFVKSFKFLLILINKSQQQLCGCIEYDYINFTVVIAVVTYLLLLLLFLFFISKDNKINSCAVNWWCVLLLSYGFCLILWASFYSSFYHFLLFCFCNMVRSYVHMYVRSTLCI